MQWRHNGKGSLNNDKSVIMIIVQIKFFKFKNWSTLLLINSILRVRLRLNLHSVVVTPHHITYSEKVSKKYIFKNLFFLNTNLKSRQSVVRSGLKFVTENNTTLIWNNCFGQTFTWRRQSFINSLELVKIRF